MFSLLYHEFFKIDFSCENLCPQPAVAGHGERPAQRVVNRRVRVDPQQV
jgi:hypothetical protein